MSFPVSSFSNFCQVVRISSPSAPSWRVVSASKSSRPPLGVGRSFAIFNVISISDLLFSSAVTSIAPARQRQEAKQAKDLSFIGRSQIVVRGAVDGFDEHAPLGAEADILQCVLRFHEYKLRG